MEIPGKKLAPCGNLPCHLDTVVGQDIECKKDILSATDGRQLGSSDLKESDRTTMIEDVIEKSFSAKSKQAVECVLAQVEQMSPTEKLLLYLKLPTGKSNVDPLRQHMNPLGSRSEIYQTITWIKTHLQEDPDVSLPKQDVYDQYLDYCSANSVKPLSTADFGKVMKQVYPDVRPRRLGTRGHSRYCYAGMRKRIRLEPPVLPDLSTNSKEYLEDSGKNGPNEQLLLTAVSCLIREWAEKVTGIKFNSLQQLAYHLVENLAVNSRSVPAMTILSTISPSRKNASRPASSNAAIGADGGSLVSAGASHLSGMSAALMTARPASETPRSSVDREHKRKLQEEPDAGKPRQLENRGVRGKRTKHRVSSSPSPSDGDAVSHPRGGPGGKRAHVSNGRASASARRTQHADQASNADALNRLEAASSQSFANVPMEKPGESVLTNGISTTNPTYSDDLAVTSTNQFGKIEEVDRTNVLSTDGSTGGKVAIPRLPKSNKQGVQNFIILPPPVQQAKQKYKPIKPKPELERAEEEEMSKKAWGNAVTNGTFDGCAKIPKSNSDAYIGCLEKDALDDYLYEGSNSQEPEEEMMQYFPPQNCRMTSTAPPAQVEGPVDKISQLRQLLERNLNQNVPGRSFQASNKNVPYQNGMSAAASLSLLSQRSQQKQNAALPAMLSHSQGSSRRVSFEVPVEPDSASSSVPPSPNTKQGVFSFTPISPRPYSPVNGRSASKPSSANASPFVSPRNTPVPRAKVNIPPQPSYMPALPPNQLFQANSGKPPVKMAQSRTYARSASATCDGSPFNFFESGHPYLAAQARPNLAALHDPNLSAPVTIDVKPEMAELHDMNNRLMANTSTDINGNRSHTNSQCALSPLQVPRVQFPVSMSAPQSPVVPTSRSSRRAKFSFRKETRAQSLEIPMSMSSHGQLINSNPAQADGMHYPEEQANTNGANADKYLSEIGFFFSEDEPGLASQPPTSAASTFRSQSVPLRRMVSSAQPQFSYYNQAQQNMYMYTPSNGSSVTPTPVPSEIADFGIDSDTILLSNNSLQQSPAAQGNTDFNTEAADLLPSNGNVQNDGVLHNILKVVIDMIGKDEKDGVPGAGTPHNQPPSQQSHSTATHGQSHSYPSTPLPYKPMEECSLRGDPLFNSFQLQTGTDTNVNSYPAQGYDVLFSAGGTPEDEEPLSAPTVDDGVSVLDGLDDISGRDLQVDGGQPPDLTGQGNMGLLLEEPPASYMTEVFEYNELASGISE